MICPVCGNGVKAAAKFCGACGNKVPAAPPRVQPAKMQKLELSARTTHQPFTFWREVGILKRRDDKSAKHAGDLSSVASKTGSIWVLLGFLALLGVAAFAFRSDPTLVWWLLAYAPNVVLWYWVIFMGGARWLAGNFLTIFIIDIVAFFLSEDLLRIYVWVFFILHTATFVFGLFSPETRAF